MKRLLLLMFSLGTLVCLGASCNKNGTDPVPDPDEAPANYLVVDESPLAGLQNGVNINHQTVNGVEEYTISVGRFDPYFTFEALAEDLAEGQTVIDFEYQIPQSNGIQFYFGDPAMSEDKSFKCSLEASATWARWSLDLSNQIDVFGWGKAGHRLRFDLDNNASSKDFIFKFRKLHFRKYTKAEQEEAEKDPDSSLNRRQRADAISTYLSAEFSSSISSVVVSDLNVTISGTAAESGLELVELMPSDDITDSHFANRQAVSGSFKAELNRFASRSGYTYDRALSRWALVKAVSADEDRICSHAHYADAIPCSIDIPEVKMRSKKGLAGYFGHSIQIGDLDGLQVTSTTVNVTPCQFLLSSPKGASYTHYYGGQKYYVSKSQIDAYDKLLKKLRKKDIMVSAIILIEKTSLDPEIAKRLVHPNCDGGNYSMPNMTTVEGFTAYAAMLDFLAQRYSPADTTYGCIHNWILQNEVDAASTWTNMGYNQPELLVTNEYEKSLRLCYNIARQYYPHAKVLGSFTHTWTASDNSDGYTAKSMLTDLVRFSTAEGDFEWGVAAHPYPQNLKDPCLWKNDTQATYSMDAGFVTFKNLEVLDKWIRMPENMYKGSIKRALWLSENGVSSASNTEKDLANQAAGAAWALKKVFALPGIDGIQWHNWYDHATESQQGLHLGLRNSMYEIKPVFYVYQAAGTSYEASVLDQYLPVIGISSWNEIFHEVE